MVEMVFPDLPQGEELGIDTVLGTLDAMSQSYTLLASKVRELAIQMPERTRQNWEVLCRAAESGQVEEVHALRGLFLQRVDRRLALMRNAQEAVKRAALLSGAAIPAIDGMERAQAGLEAFKQEIFSRWQTVEDLEGIILARHTLTNEQLAAVRQTLPAFHAQWYAEDSKPF